MLRLLVKHQNPVVVIQLFPQLCCGYNSAQTATEY